MDKLAISKAEWEKYVCSECSYWKDENKDELEYCDKSYEQMDDCQINGSSETGITIWDIIEANKKKSN